MYLPYGAVCLLILLSMIRDVHGFNNCFAVSIKSSGVLRRQLLTGNSVRYTKQTSSFKTYALEPGVAKRIVEIRAHYEALDARVKQEKADNVVHDGEILSTLENLGIIVESDEAMR